MTNASGTYGGFNGPNVDLNLLRANRLYGDVDQESRLDALIQKNAQRKTWLIFYMHDVRENPSPYGCTPALFESVVSFAARRGSQLRSIGPVLAQLGVFADLGREEAENRDGLLSLRLAKGREIPEDGVIRVTIQDALEGMPA